MPYYNHDNDADCCEHCDAPAIEDGLCEHHVSQRDAAYYPAGSEERAMLQDC